LQAQRLVDWQPRPHGKIGLGQVHRIFVIVCHSFPLTLCRYFKQTYIVLENDRNTP
jgi:hypothetical protein